MIPSTETLIRTIDLLSLEILRLNTEIQLLKKSQPQGPNKKKLQKNNGSYETLLQRSLRYYKTHGLKNTLARIRKALRGG